MTVEEALVSALDFEHRVRDHYARAAERTTDKNANRIFVSLAIEEQIHVDYLKTALTNWKNNNILDIKALRTSLPDKEWINLGWEKLSKVDLKTDFKNELEMLRGALSLESAVSDHYAKLVENLDGDIQKMFYKFLEMEEYHLAIIGMVVDSIERDNTLLEIPSKKSD
ncbi:MAG: hypothetical protein HN356_04180 [Calditrichaeota bacterium]|jgi:rubrerythrin|nr:hypothetical protein [Calditrichota bacterium]MBT7788278.1 hypothetical protein [Calditrichota bacterium]